MFYIQKLVFLTLYIIYFLIQMAAYETYETDFVYDSMDNPSAEKVEVLVFEHLVYHLR